MLPEKELKLVHFQLTRNCNLRCWFCGQWGRKGFFSNASGNAMEYRDWEKVIYDLINYRTNSGISPKVMLWGGEPLMCPDFDNIARLLKENGFEVGMVTNGVLIDKHIDVIKECVKKVYISIDGPKNIHNSIRGEGVFEKVTENIKLLHNTPVEIVVMSVLSEELCNDLAEFLDILSEHDIREVLLQEMIYLSKDEIDKYCIWFENCFGKKPTEIYSWQIEGNEDYLKEKSFLKNILQKEYNFSLKYLPHGMVDGETNCISAFNHAHIAWNGNVLYCTDFYDFSAGNVKENDIVDIFNNSISEKFRREVLAGNCVTCNHCSWRGNKEFEL